MTGNSIIEKSQNMEKSEKFKALCIAILAQSGNCQESQLAFRGTESIQQMCAAWHKYWHGMITEVPQQVMAAFRDFYPDYKSEINAAGIFYNEDSPTGNVLIGDSTETIHLYHAHTAYILGNARVVLHNIASALVMNPDCHVELRDFSRATVKEGHAVARNQSRLTTNVSAECYDMSVVNITAGTLTDHGHRAVYAFGNAVVNSFTRQFISIYDNAQVNIKKQ